MPDAAPGCVLTIDQLAERVGMTVRNIRAHQSRGLLPPPIRRGRTNYYGAAHEQALAQVRKLQRRGYNLAAIAEMLAPPASSDTATQRLLLAPLLAGDEVVLTRDELTAVFGVRPSARRLRLALENGLIRDLGEGRYLAPSQRLIDATLSLVDMGMPIVDVFELQFDVTRSTRRVARSFVEACLRAAMESTDDQPLTQQRWDEVSERFHRLRVLAIMVLASTFAINVRRASEAILAAQEGRDSSPPDDTATAPSP